MMAYSNLGREIEGHATVKFKADAYIRNTRGFKFGSMMAYSHLPKRGLTFEHNNIIHFYN